MYLIKTVDNISFYEVIKYYIIIVYWYKRIPGLYFVYEHMYIDGIIHVSRCLLPIQFPFYVYWLMYASRVTTYLTYNIEN